MSTEPKSKLVVLSNRLPVVLSKVDDEWNLKPGSGGLVSAMAPVLRDRGGTWIGWTGTVDAEDAGEVLKGFSQEAGYELRPVSLTNEEVDDFYYGFSNEVVWPLFHDFQSRCVFNPDYWHCYLGVNLKFAEEVAASTGKDDYVWVHDYHLMHVAWTLKQMGVKRKTGFFLHIPFPTPDTFLKLPWRAKVIQALLEFDLVGFHTLRDRKNFIKCVRTFYPTAKVRGRGTVLNIIMGERVIRAGVFPISIDYKSWNKSANEPNVVEMATEFKMALHNRHIILGVDRLDYTKGIPERLEAMRAALRMYPDELLGKISLVQIVVPSRQDVAEYKVLKEQIEQLVGEINGEFTRPGYIPIHYQFRSLGRDELLSYYRAASTALVTPLRDGMNLVAKEYCACQSKGDGVLILTEFAGAAAQLQHGAILVNPHDVVGVAKAILASYRMSPEEKSKRMRKMRSSIRKADIFHWVDSFLKAGFSSNLSKLTPLPDEPVFLSEEESGK